MSRHAAKISVPYEDFLKWLDFEKGRIHAIAVDYDRLHKIIVVIEHPDLPAVQEGEMLQEVSPVYTAIQYGNRTDPPKKFLARLYRRYWSVNIPLRKRIADNRFLRRLFVNSKFAPER